MANSGEFFPRPGHPHFTDVLPQGFVHASEESKKTKEDEPFPSIDMNLIEGSPDEVAAVFHVPIAALLAPSRLRSSLFRGGRPYWSIDVTDIVSSHVEAVVPDPEEEMIVDEVGPGTSGKIEVWGLTGWYISLLMKKLGGYR